MATTTRETLWIHPGNFAPRLQFGPLTPFEATLREFICADFIEILDVDPWLRSARLSPKGRRIAMPILRLVLGVQEPPIRMQDWAELYPKIFKWATEYFYLWRDADQPPPSSNLPKVRARQFS